MFIITDRGIDFTIKLALRLSLLIIGTSMLALTTTPMELTDAIESLLKPLKYIKVRPSLYKNKLISPVKIKRKSTSFRLLSTIFKGIFAIIVTADKNMIT